MRCGDEKEAIHCWLSAFGVQPHAYMNGINWGWWRSNKIHRSPFILLRAVGRLPNASICIYSVESNVQQGIGRLPNRILLDLENRGRGSWYKSQRKESVTDAVLITFFKLKEKNIVFLVFKLIEYISSVMDGWGNTLHAKGPAFSVAQGSN